MTDQRSFFFYRVEDARIRTAESLKAVRTVLKILSVGGVTVHERVLEAFLEDLPK